MNREKKSITFGASLSIKQCRNFNINDQKVLRFAMKNLGITRLRLMSYWDEIETEQGIYNFEYLDEQIKTVSKYNGTITLCIGARQPRWPESHWPDWVEGMNPTDRNKALLKFIETTINRYKKNPCIVSWQLENEALLKNFGLSGDFDRGRLRKQYKLVKRLDPDRPIIMTTSTSWGMPLRRPIPDIVGFSFYHTTYDKGSYRKSVYQPWIFKLRASLIKLLLRRPSFIHELQAEPWGPKNIWEMSESMQAESMSAKQFKHNVDLAIRSNLSPIDFWGLEWWYWSRIHGKPEIANIIRSITSDSRPK